MKKKNEGIRIGEDEEEGPPRAPPTPHPRPPTRPTSPPPGGGEGEGGEVGIMNFNFF